MFFKRKNINPDFQGELLKEDSSRTENKEVSKATALQGKQEKSAEAPKQDDSPLQRKLREAEERNRQIDDTRKQLEQEQATKHYYHRRLLETLDLALLSSLEKERAKNIFMTPSCN